MDTGDILFYLLAVVLQIVLISLNAIFAAAEIAVVSMNETKLNALTAKGGKNAKKAKRLARLTSDPARFLSTIQVAITLAGFLGSAFAADMFAEPLTGLIMKTGISADFEQTISTICVVVITLILAFFNIVLGELVPKRIAMKHAEGVSTGLSGILTFVSVAFKPIVALLSVSTNAVLRMFGISPEDPAEEVTEEEIIMMADAATESGSIEDEESQFIKNIFQFSDLPIGEICTHRKEANVLFVNATDEQWEDVIYSTNHTYYPVCGDSIDDVVGILYTKAYFRLKDKSRESIMANAVQSPVFLYENAPANIVLDKMKKTHEYFAVVTDEYGGMAGIVTIHDLLEALVGDMDEKDEEADYTITKLEGEDDLWEINGIAPLDKVEQALDITIPAENGIVHETFSGYVCGIIVTLPEDGTQFEVSTELLDIKVLTVEKQSLTKMQVRVHRPVEDDEEEDED